MSVQGNNNLCNEYPSKAKSNDPNLKLLISLEKIVFNLNEGNYDSLLQLTLKLFDSKFPNVFNMVISNLIYYAFLSKNGNGDIYIKYLEDLQTKEKENEICRSLNLLQDIFEIFVNCLLQYKSHDSYYLIEKVIKNTLVHPGVTQTIDSKYFMHYQDQEHIRAWCLKDRMVKEVHDHLKALSKNNWELHRQLIDAGINPIKISQIIRNDQIIPLQTASLNPKFNFNQNINPSLYERHSFINEEKVKLIDYAAFFGSVNCFKFLLSKKSNVKYTGKYAIAGGNMEIFKLCLQNHSLFEDAYETAIKFHRYDIFKYLYKNKIGKEESVNDLARMCVQCGNYEILSFLEEEGFKPDESFIRETIKSVNIHLVKHFINTI